MGSNKLELNILLKRIELLEMQVKELKIMEPEVFNERMSRIEDKLFSVKEMLTTTEVAEYLGVTQSQIYKLTMNLEIPHFKPKGKLIYFDRKELHVSYLQLIIPQYFISNKSGIWSLSLIVHSKG